jgi:hypothetical protein
MADRQFRVIFVPLTIVIPAEAGIYGPTARAVARWAPACAGATISAVMTL